MTRRFWILLAAALAGCGSKAPALPNLFPDTVAGVWRRTALVDMPVSDAPDPVPRNAVESIAAASYEGPGKLEARVYQLTSSGVALELVQRWRPSSDTVFFYRDRAFVVIKWQQADRNALAAFVRDLENRLGGKGAAGGSL